MQSSHRGDKSDALPVVAKCIQLCVELLGGFYDFHIQIYISMARIFSSNWGAK